ncbi:MAG: creatininase family protein [Spirochaetales bacterium]|jgi:creatinine amidohydrolase|nr:creatininase family protein [Spirochaetales bacterium]
MPERSEDRWIKTDYPDIMFENTSVGRLKKEIWDASEGQIDQILVDYGIPSPSGLGIAGTYIQNTSRAKVVERRRKNDIVLVPLGCTENHGMHSNSGLDTFMVSQMLEGVRRYTAKRDCECTLAFSPLNYGGHPYHHIGMPGTINMPQEVVVENLIYAMAGLWDDGFRKIILVNNHGQSWMIETAIHEFFKRFQVPGIIRYIDWHRATREFWTPVGRDNWVETPFLHADESETSTGLLLFPDMMDMSYAVDSWGVNYLPDEHFDMPIDCYRRPNRFSEGEGQSAIEIKGTPKGVVGAPTKAKKEKARRPVSFFMKYLTLVHDQILEKYPAGKLPPSDMLTMRTEEELRPYLKEPQSEGWKSIYQIPRLGVFEKL